MNIREHIIRFNSPSGKIIGWKKCWTGRRRDFYSTSKNNRIIVKLEIPADAHVIRGNIRASYRKQKYRASEAKVIAFYTFTGGRHTKNYTLTPIKKRFVKSFWRTNFLYKVGKTVFPTNIFDMDCYTTCGSGIHFYKTKKAAIRH